MKTFIAVQCVLFDFPVLFIILSYPFLLFAQLRRIRQKQRTVANAGTVMATVLRGSEESTHNIHNEEKKKVKSSGRVLLVARSFKVLTLVTSSLLICSVLSPVYYTILFFEDISQRTVLKSLSDVLYTLQAVVDPVVLLIALPELRRSVRQAFSFA